LLKASLMEMPPMADEMINFVTSNYQLYRRSETVIAVTI